MYYDPMRREKALIILLAITLISLEIVASPIIYAFLSDSYRLKPSYIYSKPLHSSFNDTNIGEIKIGVSKDFTIDKIRKLYFGDIRKGVTDRLKLYRRTGWLFKPIIIDKRTNDMVDNEQLYKLMITHKDGPYQYLRIMLSGSERYGIINVSLSSIIPGIKGFIEVNRGKIIAVVIMIRLHNSETPRDRLNIDLSANIVADSSVILSNHTIKEIGVSRSWAMIVVYVKLPTNPSIYNNLSLTINTSLSSGIDRFFRNVTIDFEFVGIYLVIVSSYPLILKIPETPMIKSLYKYTIIEWKRPFLGEYYKALRRLREVVDEKYRNGYIDVEIGRVYVTHLIREPFIFFTDSHYVKFAVFTSLTIVIDHNILEEAHGSNIIRYIELADSNYIFMNPINGLRTKPILRVEEPSITKASIMVYSHKLIDEVKTYVHSGDWFASEREPYIRSIVVYDSKIQPVNSSIKPIPSLTSATYYAPSILIPIDMLKHHIASSNPWVNDVNSSIYIVKINNRYALSVDQSLKHIINTEMVRTIDDIPTFFYFIRSSIYFDYPGNINGIDNIKKFFSSESVNPAILEMSYDKIITDTNMSHYILNIIVYAWHYYCGVPEYTLYKIPGKVLVASEIYVVNLSFYLSIVQHGVDEDYIGVVATEKMTFSYVKVFNIFVEGRLG